MSDFIRKDAKIFVAGHRGLAGSAIVRKLRSLGYRNLLLRTRQEVDLQDSNAVSRFLTSSVQSSSFLLRPGWGDSRQPRLPCRFHRPESAHPEQT